MEVKDTAYFNRIGKGRMAELMGIEILSVEPGQKLTCRLRIRPDHYAPNGLLHAGAAVTLADTACGYATIASLAEGAKGHATIELKCNFTATPKQGPLYCEAVPVHMGRTIQVWDAIVADESSKRAIAHFRCTQMIFWENAEGK
jgi:1,4-dihydroxy-2-naphthoyl-CoA hydrolase